MVNVEVKDSFSSGVSIVRDHRILPDGIYIAEKFVQMWLDLNDLIVANTIPDEDVKNA